MKAISINAYEIENDDDETMVFMTPKEFDFIKKQNDLKDKEIERLKQGYCELKEKCNKGECDCTNEEYNGMCEENIKMDLEIERLHSIIKEVRECIYHYAIENEDYSKTYNQEEKELLEILDKEKYED